MAVVSLALLATVLFPLIRRDPAARFWCLGSVLSLVPIAAVGPQNLRLNLVALLLLTHLVAAPFFAWLTAGQRFELTGFTAEVSALNERGEPTTILYRFGVPLEDPTLRWLRWRGDGYVPWQPPAVGGSVILRRSSDFFG